MAFDVATLALIQVDYEESDLTVVKIGLKYGCSPSYISRLAREYGWLLRSERLGRRPRLGQWASRQAREAIAQRLSRVINKKLDQMEQGMESGELGAEEAERGAKMVGSMLGGFERVAAAPEEDNVRNAKAADADTADEVERLQREIIERFERIQRRREAEGGLS
jgi:uncharacterized protein YjcR